MINPLLPHSHSFTIYTIHTIHIHRLGILVHVMMPASPNPNVTYLKVSVRVRVRVRL